MNTTTNNVIDFNAHLEAKKDIAELQAMIDYQKRLNDGTELENIAVYLPRGLTNKTQLEDGSYLVWAVGQSFGLQSKIEVINGRFLIDSLEFALEEIARKAGQTSIALTDLFSSQISEEMWVFSIDYTFEI